MIISTCSTAEKMVKKIGHEKLDGLKGQFRLEHLRSMCSHIKIWRHAWALYLIESEMDKMCSF